MKMSNVRWKVSTHFRTKKSEYLKEKNNKLELCSKYKNIKDLCRGINEFKKGYRTISNLVKDERGD
jgi:hypothetical protein